MFHERPVVTKKRRLQQEISFGHGLSVECVFAEEPYPADAINIFLRSKTE